MLDNSPVLIGMAAWREFKGDVQTYNFGRYGATAVLTRVSYFKDWISNYAESVTVYSL
jgi:secreted trypsin-like serine protease